jgi:hypothetical protein
MYNKALDFLAMRIGNENCSPAPIHGHDGCCCQFGLGSFSDSRRRFAAQVCSVRAARSLSGFGTLSDLSEVYNFFLDAAILVMSPTVISFSTFYRQIRY